MAKHAHNTSPSRRHTLFAAAGAVIMGSGITAGVAASTADWIPADTDAELIAACAQFVAIERQCRARLNSAHTAEEEDRAEEFRRDLCGGDRHSEWPVFNRVCTTPGSSHAAAIALASAIAMFDYGEIVAPEDDPDDYVTPRLLAALMRCLLAARA